MRKRILALSLSLLFLGGMSINSYAMITNTIEISNVKDDDDKNKKKSSSKKDCKTKKECCKHDFEKKECKDTKVSPAKKDGDKLK